MKWNVSMLCFVSLMVLASVTAQRRCLPRNAKCSDSTQCLSKYCRGTQCINFRDADDDQGIENPCNAKNCEHGKRCVLREVICVKFPCYPIAECI